MTVMKIASMLRRCVCMSRCLGSVFIPVHVCVYQVYWPPHVFVCVYEAVR